MRKVRFLLLLSITWYILECKTEKYEECKWTYVGDDSRYVTRCFTDNSGYADFLCVKLSDITKNDSDADTLVWKQVRYKTDCPAPYNWCQCFEDWDEFYHKQYCKCFVPGGPPKFPSIGLIHWQGTIYSITYPDMNKAVMGEVHKNTNGQYMKIEWTVGNKANAKFEILIPDTKGMFTKYVGSGKECSVFGGESGKTLSSIWEKYHTDRAVERESYDGDTQVWTKFERTSYEDQRWKWTVKYNKEKNYAIPIAYYDKHYFDVEEDPIIKEFDYTYVPTGDDKSFDLHTYCPDAEKWR